jgi:hypothetical protein
MWRKKNPFSFDVKDYLTDPDSYRMSYDEWVKKKEYEDSDKCDECGAWKGSLVICPECLL